MERVFFRPRWLFTSLQGLGACLDCGSSRLSFSARHKGQSSAILGLRGRGVFALGAALECNRTFVNRQSQTMASRQSRKVIRCWWLFIRFSRRNGEIYLASLSLPSGIVYHFLLNCQLQIRPEPRSTISGSLGRLSSPRPGSTNPEQMINSEALQRTYNNVRTKWDPHFEWVVNESAPWTPLRKPLDQIALALVGKDLAMWITSSDTSSPRTAQNLSSWYLQSFPSPAPSCVDGHAPTNPPGS